MAREQFVCFICNKPVSRLYGLNAAIRSPEGEELLKVSVAGYCAAHRGDVLPAYRAEMSKLGEVIQVYDKPELLRPDQAAKWLEFTTNYIDRFGGHAPGQSGA